MKCKENKAIVRGYFDEVLNNRNLSAFEHYFAEAVVFNSAQGFKQQLAVITQAMHDAFPDLHLRIEEQIAEDDKVVTRVTFRGTHQGAFNGIAPTGRQVEWSGIAIDRIANGKIAEMWHVQNTAALIRQISAKP